MISRTSRGLMVAGYSEQAILGVMLQGLGLLLAAVGVILGFFMLNAASGPDGIHWMPAMAAVSAILSALAAGAVLWALAAILRHTFRATMLLHRTEDGIDRLGNLIELSGHGASASPAGQPTATESERVGEQAMADQEMIDLLREICENTLLAESDRIAKRQRVAEEDRRRRVEAIEDLIRGGGWSAARRAVAELIKRYPDAPEGRQAHDRVEQAAAKAEEQDLRNATTRIEELMSISAWDRALGLAEELVGKHPTSVKARQLLDRVQRERRLFRQEHVRRQVMDIERAVERHRYREALSLAAGFLESYGETQEAGNLRTQMAQLRENAEVEERKQLEEEIKDLVHRRSFGEALDLAGKVIDTYPTSPQAKALREQLPKIREAAKQFADEQDELRSRVHQ